MEIIAAIIGGLFIIGAAWYAKQKPDAIVAKQNRENILREELGKTKHGEGIRSLKKLSEKSGLPKQACRDLLIEIGAKQKTMAGDEEGWTLKGDK